MTTAPAASSPRRAAAGSPPPATILNSVMPASPSPFDLGEPRLRRRDHLGERAECSQQRLGQRLDVAPRQRAEQQQLEQLVVGHRVGAGLAKALAQPLAVAVIMRQGLGEPAFGRAAFFPTSDFACNSAAAAPPRARRTPALAKDDRITEFSKCPLPTLPRFGGRIRRGDPLSRRIGRLVEIASATA